MSTQLSAGFAIVAALGFNDRVMALVQGFRPDSKPAWTRSSGTKSGLKKPRLVNHDRQMSARWKISRLAGEGCNTNAAGAAEQLWRSSGPRPGTFR